MSVLLVEDHSTVLRMVTRLLQDQHHIEVAVIGAAGGGEEALAQAQELRPEILDLREALDAVLTELHPQAEAKRLTLELQVTDAPEEPGLTPRPALGG